MQYGFVHESKNCSGCGACQAACKDKHDNEVGENLRRIKCYESGGFTKQGNGYVPNVRIYNVSIGCNHCADPKCVKNCPTGAMHKDPETGIVSVNEERCIGCGYCAMSCPYGAPQMQTKKGVMGKCDGCMDLVAKGENPACVDACPLHLLHFGDIEELRKKYPEGTAGTKDMPSPDMTHPSLVILPHKDSV